VPELIVRHHGERPPVAIEPGDRWREWMHATQERVANRCLPLLMANQSGWVLRNPSGFEARWEGGYRHEALEVTPDDPEAPQIAHSHFGHGIVTFIFDCVFQTSPGYNLLARGPANQPKDGVAPLEGLVETDWTLVPFTMNWKLTRPGSVRFEAGEAFCQLVPQRRGELEQFDVSAVSLDDTPEDAARVKQWHATRVMYELGRQSMAAAGNEKYLREWMDDYFRGRTPSGEQGEEHQTKLRLSSLG